MVLLRAKRAPGVFLALGFAIASLVPACQESSDATPVTIDRKSSADVPPPWVSVPALGRVPLDLVGAVLPRGADALVAGEPRETAVYAFKRDLAASAVTRIDVSAPHSPVVTGTLHLKGPSSAPASVGRWIVIGTEERGHAPELWVLEPHTTPRVKSRLRVAAPLLGPVAVAGDRLYFASGDPTGGHPSMSPSRVEAFRLHDAGGSVTLEPLGGTPVPAQAHALALHRNEIVVVVAGDPPLWILPLDANAVPAPPRASFGYRIVQPLTHGAYAFDGQPRWLASAADLLLLSDDNSAMVMLRVDPAPELVFRPTFDYRDGGGLLAVLPGGGDDPPADRLYRIRSTRAYVSDLDGARPPRMVHRWKLGIDGPARGLALLPGLLAVADEVYGVYFFPRRDR